MNHPIQPLAKDKYGALRFKKNTIVEYLCQNGSLKLNDLAKLDIFPREDWVQLAQLIGYSLNGFGTLSYVEDEDYNAAELMSKRKRMTADEAHAKVTKDTLASLKKAIREPIAALYGIHPDDLKL